MIRSIRWSRDQWYAGNAENKLRLKFINVSYVKSCFILVVKLYKTCNTEKELILCKGRVDVSVIQLSANVGTAAGGSGREAKASNPESFRATDSMDSMDSSIEIFIIVKEMRNDMIEKELLKKVIAKSVEEKMDKVRQEIQNWKETQSLISTFKREMYSLVQSLPTMGTSGHEAGKMKSYRKTVSSKKESVIIVN